MKAKIYIAGPYTDGDRVSYYNTATGPTVATGPAVNEVAQQCAGTDQAVAALFRKFQRYCETHWTERCPAKPPGGEANR